MLEASQCVKQALLIIVHATPFRDMTSEEQLEAWFQERLLSSADDEQRDD